MESNKSISRSDIQRQLYKALVDAYEADKILLDILAITVTLKKTVRCAPREKTTTTAGKTTTGSKTHKQSASQSALVGEKLCIYSISLKHCTQKFENKRHDEQPEEEVHPLPDWFQQPKRLPSPDRAWNKSVPADHESVQPWLSNLARRHDLKSHSMSKKQRQFYAFAASRESARDVLTQIEELLLSTRCKIVEAKTTCILTGSLYVGMTTFFTSSKKVISTDFRSRRSLKDFAASSRARKVDKFTLKNGVLHLIFNTTAGNPVKKILLKLNLSDHRLFKDGGGGS
ncbi:hypothetical protein Tco_1104282 [Tanacetum coccineum]